MQPLAQIVLSLQTGLVTAEELVDQTLSRASSTDLQGGVSFRRLFPEQAKREAQYWDTQRAQGHILPPLAGVPFSVKDNIDVEGHVTHAASRVLSDTPPAKEDAPFLAMLRAQGAIMIGQTNMTEFAYSGLGLNRHFGTPLSPIGRHQGMIAGGSTSGGAVSVAETMSLFAVGSDTSGSCRIPAACCGLVGYRPSQGLFPAEGIIPLAPSFDVPGLITSNVPDLVSVFDALCGSDEISPGSQTLSSKKLLVPTDTVLTEIDPAVQAHFEQAIAALAQLGVKTTRCAFLFDHIAEELSPSDIVAFEAHQFHQKFLKTRRADYDPRIAMRMDQASRISSERHSRLIDHMRLLRHSADEFLDEYDGVVLPTLPIIPPTCGQLTDEQDYLRMNGLIIRNTGIANHLDLPSVSIPITAATAAKTPVSLQLIGKRNADRGMLHLALSLSQHL